jgi:dTDP-4-amino-4,6-dideoxygalactose transaminase
MKIPLLDLTRQLKPIRSEINTAIERVLDSSQFIMGPDVTALESEIADYCSVTHGIGCASGSDAIVLALRAVGVKSGDEVITTAYSFYATAGSIWHIGAKPVFADICPDTFNIDVSQIPPLINSRTAAILPVHLYGQMSDMDALLDIAGPIPVVEDAAQSLGAKWNGKSIGEYSQAACLSFFPSKNLGCLGDGGMVITNSSGTAQQIQLLRSHGALKNYEHDIVGYNSRLDSIHAAALRVKLKYLDQWAENRRQNAEYYNQAFRGTKVLTPCIHSNAHSVYNQYVIQVENRDELQNHLTEKQIGSSVYYPVPLPFQPCFSSLGYEEGNFPVAEKAARKTLALPVFPELTNTEMDTIITTILDFVERKK